MGRWRPPAKASSPYITPAGYQILKTELDELWLRRRDVVKALSEAAAEGDRSENAEYIYRKKELAGIDRRIRYLQKRLPVLKVVREQPRTDAVYFGATVEVCDEDGATSEYRIVGPDETDTATAAISIDSPVAKALLGKRVDDEVTVTTDQKERIVSVLSIRYCLSGVPPATLLPVLGTVTALFALTLIATPLPAQEIYSYDRPGDRPFITNTATYEPAPPAGDDNRRQKVEIARPAANAIFTTETITVDGVREAAWDTSEIQTFRGRFDGEMDVLPELNGVSGVVQFLWDGPVLYLFVEVRGDSTPATDGVPDWNRNTFTPEQDGLFVFMDVFNDRWGMETDTQGVFFLGANPELDAVTSYNNAFIPSLGSFFNPENQDYSPRLKAFASSGYLDDGNGSGSATDTPNNGNTISYRYELALQIEGWGDAWRRELTNGTEVGIAVGIYDRGNAHTFWGNSSSASRRGGDGDYNVPNSERSRNRDWGVVTLSGWDGKARFAYSDFGAREAIRFWNSRSNPGGSGNGTAPNDYGDDSRVWTPASKARMIAAKEAFLALANDTSRAKKDAAVLEVNEAFENLRWADTSYPDPADLPATYTLPNLWQFFDETKGADGMVTNAAEWELRRQELLELAQFYEYGYKPQAGADYTLELLEATIVPDTDEAPSPVTSVPPAGERAFVRAMVTPTNSRYTGGKAREIEISLALPATNGNVERAPVGFGGNWTDIGIASMRFPNWSRDVRTHEGAWGTRTGLFYELFPYERNSTQADSSILIGNATAVSIHLDALSLAVAANEELAARIDPSRAVTRGFSIGGKNAFVAAVFDERVKVVLNGGSGATGPANWRYNAHGQEYSFIDTPFYNPGADRVIAHGTEGPGNSYRHNRVRETELFRHFMPYGHMYAHEQGAYNYGGYSRLPFDQSLLVATLAPDRAILINTNLNDFNNGAMTDNMSLQIARSAWRVLGADPDDFVKFNNGSYVSIGDPHGLASDEPERKFLSDFFFGTNTLSNEEAERLLLDPFALPVSADRSQSPYDYYWGGFNTITGGAAGTEDPDGWYYYEFNAKRAEE